MSVDSSGQGAGPVEFHTEETLNKNKEAVTPWYTKEPQSVTKPEKTQWKETVGDEARKES